MKVRATFIAVVTGLSLTIGSQARATPQLDFGVVAPTTGSIAYAGGTTPLVGTNIQVDMVVGLGTPLNNNVVSACVGCVLNFTSGNFSGSTATSWSFSGGGITTISIVGAIPTLGIAPGTTLLSGTFDPTFGATVTSQGTNRRIAGATFLDVKNATLAQFYGLSGGPTVPYSGFFNLSFNTTTTNPPPSAFTSSGVLSGDIVNEPVDVPSSLLLLGSGLVGFVYLTARTRRS